MAACGLLTLWKIAQTSQLELEIESKLENALFLSATISLLMRPRTETAVCCANPLFPV